MQPVLVTQAVLGRVPHSGRTGALGSVLPGEKVICVLWVGPSRFKQISATVLLQVAAVARRMSTTRDVGCPAAKRVHKFGTIAVELLTAPLFSYPEVIEVARLLLAITVGHELGHAEPHRPLLLESGGKI